MTQTDLLSLPFIMSSQAQKHITHNEALLTIDVLLQLSVKSRTQTTAPQALNASDRYLVPNSASGDFLNQDGKIAAYQDGVFQFYSPQTGWLVFIEDETLWQYFDGNAWIDLPGTGTSASYLDVGINATADSYNRLSLSSDASLFNHNGSGHQLKINKNTTGDTASLLFQTGFSGRAEFGLSGDDIFRIKTSSDGSNFSTAISFSDDYCRFDQPAQLPSYSVATLPSATMSGAMIYVSDASGGAIIAFCDGSNWRRTDTSAILT